MSRFCWSTSLSLSSICCRSVVPLRLAEAAFLGSGFGLGFATLLTLTGLVALDGNPVVLAGVFVVDELLTVFFGLGDFSGAAFFFGFADLTVFTDFAGVLAAFFGVAADFAVLTVVFFAAFFVVFAVETEVPAFLAGVFGSFFSAFRLFLLCLGIGSPSQRGD